MEFNTQTKLYFPYVNRINEVKGQRLATKNAAHQLFKHTFNLPVVCELKNVNWCQNECTCTSSAWPERSTHCQAVELHYYNNYGP